MFSMTLVMVYASPAVKSLVCLGYVARITVTLAQYMLALLGNKQRVILP